LTLQHNSPEYTVSEISGRIKRVVEDTFGYVRVRGEISKASVNQASGHCYLSLKDDKALLDAVIWKGVMGKLAHKPQAGLEVIATGKLTTYPGSSKYQLVIEAMEPAGIGALMAMLEARKKALEAEGLFAAARKKPLPYLPETIGIITSPTGAVIRDILHRLADRFPRHVLLWPVSVQGQGAAEQVARAIAGFNRIEGVGDWGLGTGKKEISSPQSPASSPLFPRPDLIIVARGGGSIEDLWAFNEEVVVRAVAASTIPIISAVGHETDTTLIDYAADRRAPTPTAAAEMAVPVREELRTGLENNGMRMTQRMRTLLKHLAERIEGLARGLPQPQQLVSGMEQSLDSLSDRLETTLPRMLALKEERLQALSSRLITPQHRIATMEQAFASLAERLQHALPRSVQMKQERLTALSERLSPRPVLHQMERMEARLQRLTDMLESLNVLAVLKRGFALVKTEDGKVIPSAAALPQGASLRLQFYDGERAAFTGDKPSAKKTKPGAQPGLFDM